MNKYGIKWETTDNLVELQNVFYLPSKDKWKGLVDASDIINIIYDNETAKYTVFWKYIIIEDQDDTPHGNLIDKDELISQFNKKILENMPVPRENMYSLLRECVDNAPIVLERSKK